MGSFKSDNSGGGGFLARAEAARGGGDSGNMREQFSRLEVGQPQPNFMRDMGGKEPTSATLGAAASTNERDWMNFASNT